MNITLSFHEYRKLESASARFGIKCKAKFAKAAVNVLIELLDTMGEDGATDKEIAQMFGKLSAWQRTIDGDKSNLIVRRNVKG